MYPSVTKKRPISYRQLRTVDLWLKYGRRSKARALREAGYSRAVIRQPHKVFSSPAVREELDKRGLGYDGLRDNLTPNAKPILVYREPQKLPDIPKETLQILKERLREVGYVTQPIQEVNDNGATTNNARGLFC